MAEDRAGQEVLRAAEAATYVSRLKADFKKVDMGLSRENDRYLRYAHGLPCRAEDDHVFDSTGQCSLCGAHRKPM